MLCRKHHDAYDGRSKYKLWIRELTPERADGQLQFIDEAAQ